RIDHPWTDCVDGDAEAAELFGGRAREAEEAGLRCRVVCAAEGADHTSGGGGDINDAAVVLRLHRWKDGLCQKKRRDQIDLQRLAELFGREVRKSRRARKR